jgi:FAD synthase
MLMILEGTVVKGMGIARQIGFPTVNITNDNGIEPNLYAIHHEEHGYGSAFVMNDYAEVHFLNEPGDIEEILSCEILKGLFKEDTVLPTGTLIHVLYDGIMKERKKKE